MDTLYDLLVKLGPSWTSSLLTIASAAIICFVVFNRKFASLKQAGYEDMIKIRDRQILDHTVRITELSGERDRYREEKHLLSNDLQAAILKLEEMKGLPDMRILVEMMKGQAEVLTKLFSLIEKMDTKLDKEIQKC